MALTPASQRPTCSTIGSEIFSARGHPLARRGLLVDATISPQNLRADPQSVAVRAAPSWRPSPGAAQCGTGAQPKVSPSRSTTP